jgi:multiple sugar transport system permease protein
LPGPARPRGPPRPPWRPSLTARNSLLSYILLAPSIALAAVFIAYPLYLIGSLSVRDGRTMIMSDVGELPLTTDNFREVLSNPETWEGLRISVIYTAATVAGAILVGLVTALLLRRQLPGRRWFRTFILVPWPIPGSIATVAFVWMLDGTYGVANYLLRKANVIDENVAWYFNPDTALVGVLAPTIWIAYPLCTLMVLASLQSIPDDLYEAARIDGASSGQQFRHVTWPAIQNTAVLAMIVTGLWSFTTFDFVYAITRGGPDGATQTLAVAIYNQAFRFFDLPYASALGVVTMLIASTALLALFPVVRRRFF